MQDIINYFQANWAQILLIAVSVHTALKAIRDAIDKTPATDDNWFERMVTIIGKAIGYLTTGKRA